MASLSFQLNDGAATVSATVAVSPSDLATLESAIRDALGNPAASGQQQILDYLVRIWKSQTIAFVQGYQRKQTEPPPIVL